MVAPWLFLSCFFTQFMKCALLYLSNKNCEKGVTICCQHKRLLISYLIFFLYLSCEGPYHVDLYPKKFFVLVEFLEFQSAHALLLVHVTQNNREIIILKLFFLVKFPNCSIILHSTKQEIMFIGIFSIQLLIIDGDTMHNLTRGSKAERDLQERLEFNVKNK